PAARLPIAPVEASPQLGEIEPREIALAEANSSKHPALELGALPDEAGEEACCKRSEEHQTKGAQAPQELETGPAPARGGWGRNHGSAGPGLLRFPRRIPVRVRFTHRRPPPHLGGSIGNLLGRTTRRPGPRPSAK